MLYYIIFLSLLLTKNNNISINNTNQKSTTIEKIQKTSKNNLVKDIDFVKNFNINDKSNNLSLLHDLEGTSIILKVEDKEGKNLGVFKPDSGSTLARGEYAMFKIGEYINFNIYPACILSKLNIKSLIRVKELLESKKYNKFYGKRHIGHMKAKEKNRIIMLKTLSNLIKNNTPLEGVFKVWVNNIQFYYSIGTLEGLKKHPTYKYMFYNSKDPPRKAFTIKQCTKLFKPYGCTYANTYIDIITKDMSSLLVVDAILGNRDRFPGGNVHFQNLGKVKRKAKNTYFSLARLLALDNGAVLKKTKYKNTKFLEELKISKFNKSHIDKLKELRKKDNLQDFLGLKNDEFNLLKTNFDNTLNYINNLEKTYKDKIWFK